MCLRMNVLNVRYLNWKLETIKIYLYTEHNEFLFLSAISIEDWKIKTAGNSKESVIKKENRAFTSKTQTFQGKFQEN